MTKAAYGRVANIKKVPSRSVAVIMIEVPVESYVEAVTSFDEKDVLITIAPKDLNGGYGVVVSEPVSVKLDIGSDDCVSGATVAKMIEAANPEMLVTTQKPRGLKLSNVAAMWCKDEHFQNWLSLKLLTPIDEKMATNYVRNSCLIESRSELDSNKQAAAYFIEHIRDPYQKAMQS